MIVPFTCQACGGTFAPDGGGVCAVCRRLLCSRHFKGWLRNLVLGTRRSEQTQQTCVDCEAGAHTRDVLISSVLDFVASNELLTRQEIRASLEREIASAGPQALVDLKTRLSADTGWDYYPADPLARRIHHLLEDRFIRPESELRGREHVTTVADRRVILFANHLSYADANVIDVLLQRAGCDRLADRLTAVAGPKVFSERQRRFSSLCFGTIKVPQSLEVSSEDAVLPSRDVARAARHAITVAHRRLEAGDALLLFGEGTRSRTAQMRPLLAAVARYLEVPDVWVLPVGLTGPEHLFPVGDTNISPRRVVMTLGAPFPASAILSRAGRDRRLAMDAIGLSIARLLPPEYQGAYREIDQFVAAGSILDHARETTNDYCGR